MCHHFIKRVILGESAETEEERQGREGKGWKGARVRLRQSPAEGSSLLTLQVGSGVLGTPRTCQHQGQRMLLENALGLRRYLVLKC